MTEVRRATIADRADVVESVAAAFHDEPTMQWLFQDDRERQVRAFFGYLFDRRVDDAEVWSVPTVGAALWEPPGGLPDGGHDAYERMAGLITPGALERVEFYHRVMEDRIPTEGAWYLGVLAVRPERQANGVGRRLFNSVRHRADPAGETIVLETAVADNLGMYRHWGFALIDHLTVPDGGPPVWVMRRSAGTGVW